MSNARASLIASRILDPINNAIEQEFSFFVHGIPCPQGSKNAFARMKPNKNGRMTPVAVMVEQSRGLPVWRNAVKTEALKNKPKDWVLSGLFFVTAIYYFPRPALHRKSNGELKNDAPIIKITKPDRDKLDRGIGDALTGAAYADDANLAIGFSVKIYCDGQKTPGAFISVARVDPALAGPPIAWLAP